MSEEFPKYLLRDVLWAFGGAPFESEADFNREISRYHLDIRGRDTWEPERAVLKAPSVQVVYEFWKGDKEVEKTVEIRAGNGESLTAGELLFKIHNLVTEDLDGMDRHFFEGLSLDAPPTYRLRLGS